MRKILLLLLVVFLMLLSSCGKSSAPVTVENVRTGIESIVMEFLPNNPPNEMHVSEPEEKFLLVMQVNNKGAYPQPEDISYLAPPGKIYLSGFDTKIIKFEAREYGAGSMIDTEKTALEGKSSINPNGGQDIITFEGTVFKDQLNVKKYDPIIMATACFKYETVAAPQVCIDPIPYATNVKKVCTPSHITMQNQGGPIAVTMLNVEPFASKTQFKITVKNLGDGQVFRDTYKDKCGLPQAPNTYNEDVDKVKLEIAQVAGIALECGPFANDGQNTNSKATSGYIRLINGEGYVICEIELSKLEAARGEDLQTPFTTPMKIHLSYAYKTSTQRQMTILKE